jgi:hypothetical protein
MFFLWMIVFSHVGIFFNWWVQLKKVISNSTITCFLRQDLNDRITCFWDGGGTQILPLTQNSGHFGIVHGCWSCSLKTKVSLWKGERDRRSRDVLGKEKGVLEKDKCALKSKKVKYFGTKFECYNVNYFVTDRVHYYYNV